jgi:hypothetical protein
MKLQTFIFQMSVISSISVQYLRKYGFANSSVNLYAPCIFPYHLMKHNLRTKLLILKCVLIFSTNSVRNVSHFKKNWARYKKKLRIGLHVKCRYPRQILMKLEFSLEIFEKYSSIKFQKQSVELETNCSIADRLADRYDEAKILHTLNLTKNLMPSDPNVFYCLYKQ